MSELSPKEVANVEVQSLFNQRALLIFGNADWHGCELCWLARWSQEGNLRPLESVLCNCHGHRPHAGPPANTTTLSIHSS